MIWHYCRPIFFHIVVVLVQFEDHFLQLFILFPTDPDFLLKQGVLLKYLFQHYFLTLPRIHQFVSLCSLFSDGRFQFLSFCELQLDFSTHSHVLALQIVNTALYSFDFFLYVLVVWFNDGLILLVALLILQVQLLDLPIDVLTADLACTDLFIQTIYPSSSLVIQSALHLQIVNFSL